MRKESGRKKVKGKDMLIRRNPQIAENKPLRPFTVTRKTEAYPLYHCGSLK